jgi:hypothetical protein
LYWQPLPGGTTGPLSSPKEPLLPPPLLPPLPLPLSLSTPPLELPPLLLELPGFANPEVGADEEHAAMATMRKATLTMREGFMAGLGS